MYIIASEMDKLYHLIETEQIQIPPEYAFLLRVGATDPGQICDHPIALYDLETGFYIDLMRLTELELSGMVKHNIYLIPTTSFSPTKPCQLGGIEFHCPRNVLNFIGPPGRDYHWETLILEKSLSHCGYYEKINGTKWNRYTMSQIHELYGQLIDPKYNWLG